MLFSCQFSAITSAKNNCTRYLQYYIDGVKIYVDRNCEACLGGRPIYYTTRNQNFSIGTKPTGKYKIPIEKLGIDFPVTSSTDRIKATEIGNFPVGEQISLLVHQFPCR